MESMNERNEDEQLEEQQDEIGEREGCELAMKYLTPMPVATVSTE